MGERFKIPAAREQGIRDAVRDAVSLQYYEARDLLAELDATRAALADAERGLALLERVRAHPALDWHLTDIEGARDVAESPEAREICELTMALLSPGDAGRGDGK